MLEPSHLCWEHLYCLGDVSCDWQIGSPKTNTIVECGVRSVCTNDIMLVAGMSRWPAPGGGEKVINLTEDCVGYTLEVHNGITGSHTPHMLHLTGHIVMQYVTIRHTNTPLPVREIRPSLA